MHEAGACGIVGARRGFPRADGMEQLEREPSKVRTSQDVLLEMLSPVQAQALVLVRTRMAEDAEVFNSRTKHSGTTVQST